MNAQSNLLLALRVLLVSIVVLWFLVGCAGKPIDSRLLNQCYTLVVPQLIWHGREDSSVGEYLLTSTGRDSVFWDKEIVGQLYAGDSVRVVQVLKGWNGSYGDFLWVRVEVLDGSFQGIWMDVPSYAPYHPGPTWIAEWTSDPNELRFKPEIARPCDT